MTIITYTIGANGKATIPKDPSAKKVYGINLAAVLAEANTTISSASIAEAVGVSVVGGATVQDTRLLARVEGGTVGQEGHVTFHYVLSDGTEDDQTIYFDIRQR